jgi:hypothetical protein
MPKGIVTQTFCILLEEAVTIDQVRVVLEEFGESRDVPASESWAFGGPTLIFPTENNTNGTVVVDVVDEQWPDSMGHPDDEPTIYGAWSMGHFGPFTYPGSLDRTRQQCWMWEDGGEEAARHTGFVRIRVGYSFGGENDAPLIPDNYDSVEELNYITSIAAALLDLPAAICYFNPSGETLLDAQLFEEARVYAEQAGLPPLDVWTNIRLFNIDQQWVLMDTVGNEQFEGKDCEACFRSEEYNLQEVNAFLRNLSLLTMNHPEVIEDGMEMPGPNDVPWRMEFANSVCPAPRPVLRWIPVDGAEFPREKLPSDEVEEDSEEDAEEDAEEE